MLRAIVVDDEEWAIRRLRRLLSENGLIEICETFQHPLEAYEYVRANPIDVAFLDISMPDINGMKLSALLSELDEGINVIFVTGYEEYALQAFDMSALDYLMKPVSEDRLKKALGKIKKLRRVTDRVSNISVFLFNGLKIYAGGSEPTLLKLRSPKTEELFAYLICKGTVSRDKIIETLWPELKYEKALQNLNTNLYYIRRSLKLSNSQARIHTNHHEISIERDSIYCDLYEFEGITKRVTAMGMDDIALMERAESLYSGPFLQGRDYHWSGEFMQYYDQAYLGLLDAAARHCLSEGKHDSALRYFKSIIEKDKLREDAYVEIIRIYLRMGRRIDAIRSFRQLENMLSTELGIVPNPSIVEMMQDMS